ncbi:YDG domain-containing protein [Flavobacterium sp. SM15]|uniref:YDG domain-containing protein n=1 Tax=Flavobacterium sp. SM15 TaxID=2908005 RepID=UPI001EDB408F|nr:YDG domain-containing protein [Flavobacterium sp. SM15]MCG2612178.1 YDG domain-containing protein [Flavobacterium sp. SM15]
MKFKLLLLSFLMAATYGWGQTVLANYKFENNLTVEAGAIGTPALSASSAVSYFAGVTGQAASFASSAGKYFELTISTTGYTGVDISFAGRSSAAGTSWVVTGDPTGGVAFAAVTSLACPNGSFASLTPFSLGGGYDNKASIRLRITATGSGTATMRIDDLIIRGVPVGGVPSITSSLTSSSVYGSAYSYNITASGVPTSYNATGLPSGLSINTTTGAITGTPTVGVGSYNIDISATNGSGTDTKTLVLTITAKNLTISGLTADNKVYDRTTTATLSGTPSLVGVVGSDVVSLSGVPTASFATFTVGVAKPVTVSGYTLSGAQSGNYTLTQPTGLTANITAKPLTVSGAVANNKVYDGTTTATISGATLVGVIAPDAVTLNPSGTFATANVGVGIAVTSTSTISGAASGNYTLTQPVGLSADITQASQTITFNPLPVQYVGAPNFNLTATSSSGLAITYVSSNPAVATVSGNTVTIVGVGTTVITASQAGNANYAAATSVNQNQVVTTAPCVNEDFVSFTDWTDNGTASDAVASHYGAAAPCRALGISDYLITPSVNFPTTLQFHQDNSNPGSGTVDYRIGAGPWLPCYTFVTNSAGANENVNLTNISGVDLSVQSNVTFRFNSSFNTWYLDDVVIICGPPPASCTTPTAQPTALSFSAITTSAFNGSFTAASPAPSGYLVVYSTSATLAAADLPVDGTSYTAGNTLGDGTVAYSGAGNSFSVTGLTSGTTYYVFVFSYNTGSCAIAYNTATPLSNSVTTVAAYCASSGNTSFQTSVTNVTFNTINNTSGKPSGYSDYTGISTTVQQGNSYSLSSRINTDGNFTVLAFAWIDFNHDLDFNDPGEAFDLGSATNVASGLSSSSPLSINIPLTAAIGATRMRVIATYDGDSSPCLSGFDGEVEDYTINIIAACVPTHAVTSFAPASGPTGTDVTITGSGFTAGTTVMFNGISAVVTYVNATTIIATVPSGLTTGQITVTEGGCKVNTVSNFTEIKQTGTCSTGNNLNDLIISEVYDSAAGNSWYMELYNPTGSPINLDAAGANYKLVRYGDIGITVGLRSVDISGTIAPGGVYVADLGSDTSCDPMTYNYTNKGNGINENDEIRLTKNDVTVDIVYCPNEKGYVIRRNAAAVGPTATYNAADWTLLTTETCANLGIVPFAYTNNLPTVNTNPSDVSGCGTTASFTIAATPAGAGVLTYQWYYNNGVSAGWTTVAAGSFAGVTASGFTSNTLGLNGAIGTLNGYQFYCQVTQAGTCSVASDAAQLKVNSTTWNGSAWSNGNPDLTKLAIINGNYDTTANGDFECCSLTINNGFTLDIKDTDYVLIQNDLTVNGTLEVQNQGSLVMVSDTGVVTNNGTTNVRKMSSTFDRYDYTFWSSPISNALISVFSQWQTNYIFKLDATKFLDANNDSHDDNQDAWVFTPQTEAMSPGRAYGVMGKITQTYPAQQGVVFTGPVNNGVITQPIGMSLDPANANDDFNLVGNPYPSAISADKFITDNADISGTLYFWTHEGDIQVAAINPGPMAYNYSPDDFAYYNLAGGTGTRAGLLSGNGNSNVPNGFIASGQGFEVDANAATNVVFNNSMRNKNHLNTNFYRSANGTQEKDRIWLNLTNPEGIFNQQLIGFFPEATPELDRGYDGYYVKSNTYAAFYSLIGDTQFKIQGREAYDVNAKVALGFRSAYEKTYTVSIGDIQGVLRTENVYLEDKQLNIIHDLKASNYVFSTPAGEFNNRFVLRFNSETLGATDFEANSNAVMVYANDVLHVASSLEPIKEVVVYDILGRVIAQKKNVNASATDFANLSKTQSTLIVKVTLENGQIVDKKVIY